LKYTSAFEGGAAFRAVNGVVVSRRVVREMLHGVVYKWTYGWDMQAYDGEINPQNAI